MAYNKIDHEIRNRVKLSMLDYCILEMIYNLSTSGKEKYSTWCNAPKSGFEHLAAPRTIINRFNGLEKDGWLEFKDSKRYLKRTTPKYYSEVFAYIKGVKKLRGEKVSLVKELHPKCATITPLKGEKVAPHNKDTINKDNKESKEAPFVFLEEMKKTLNGEIIQKTSLDKNFNFGLFQDTWSDNFQNEVLGYFRYMEQKKSDRWGILGTISSQLSVLKSYCNQYSEKEIIDSLKEAQTRGNVSYDPAWTKSRNGEQSQKTENLDLEAYLLQHFRPKDVKYMKKAGDFERWEKQLKDSKFKLSNIAKTKKNKSYTTMFLFDCCYMRLGNRLGGTTEQRKIDSLTSWEKKLSEYDRNQGDLYQLLKARP